MAKGDDAIRKKKNKLARKKNRQKETPSATVSKRVAAIIAAKKRRLSGKRRMCQGMCFSLPTLEDPYNEGKEKGHFKKKENKKARLKKADKKVDGKRNNDLSKGARGQNHVTAGNENEKMDTENLDNERKIALKLLNKLGCGDVTRQGKEKMQLARERAVPAQQGQSIEHSDCPSKFLIMCLNSIENAFRHDDYFCTEEGKPLFVGQWGVEFWRAYSMGKDILVTDGSCSTLEQIAWIASTAADSFAIKEEKEGHSSACPFLLFIVPSQENAIKASIIGFTPPDSIVPVWGTFSAKVTEWVRSVCKPLKAHGIHTVSLHPGASVDHQIHGLKSCEPEFLVSTPERLLELVHLKAIDISGVSLLVVDGLDALLEDKHEDAIKSIRQCIPSNPRTVVFSDCQRSASTLCEQYLLREPVCRLTANSSVASEATSMQL